MNNLFFLLAFAFLLVVPLSVDAIAQTNYDVNIPTGAACLDLENLFHTNSLKLVTFHTIV